MTILLYDIVCLECNAIFICPRRTITPNYEAPSMRGKECINDEIPPTGHLVAQPEPSKGGQAVVGVTSTLEEGDELSPSCSPPPQPRIDNSQNMYIPIRLSCGVLILVRPAVMIHCPLVLLDINSDITECFQLLPTSVHGLIRRTQVWVNRTYVCGTEDRPVTLRHTTAHHHEFWLSWMRDRLDKVLGVEIYDAAEFRRMRRHWNGCGLLLHEYCHIIHQFALPDGLDNQQVKKAHTLMQLTGLYDCVRRRDWAGLERDFDLAYATVDCKEFFAEMSVAYWSQAYDPMLDRQDPRRMLLCSPPFADPDVADRVRGSVDGAARARASRRLPCGGAFRQRTPHCNKFYPFTRGQLRHYDTATFDTMQSLWEEIAQWKDPLSHDDNDGSTTCC